jgi:hypothetical protein
MGKLRFISNAGLGVISFLIVFATLSADDTIATASLDAKGKQLLIAIGDNTVRFPAPEGAAWDHLVRSGDNRKVFVIDSGSKEQTVYEFSLNDYLGKPNTYVPRKIPLVSDLKDARVLEIFSASKDGSRLLISIHYCYASNAEERSFRWHPYFFDTASGTATIVEP